MDIQIMKWNFFKNGGDRGGIGILGLIPAYCAFEVWHCDLVVLVLNRLDG